MSRRDHTVNEDIDIPFSENLIFYAPLTQGDLTDHISGVELANTSSSFISWDSEYEMYRFIKQTKANENAFYTSIMYDATTFTKGLKKENTQGYTISVVCKRLSQPYYNYPPYVTVGSYKTTDTWIPCVASVTEEISYSVRELLARRTFVVNPSGNERAQYTGSTKTASTTFDSAAVNCVSNWNVQNLGEQVSVNPKRDGNDSPDVLLKDIRIYNRALTAEEVAQL